MWMLISLFLSKDFAQFEIIIKRRKKEKFQWLQHGSLISAKLKFFD
jgi:hypothetical protein